MAASYTPRVASQEEVKAASQAQLDGQSAARLAADNAFAPRAEPGSFDVADVEECLRDVIDPELGINVVDLGLLYGVEIGSSNEITLDMTLTSAACPLTDVIEEQARQVLDHLSDDVRVQWVWLPPWGPDKITPEGREQLRALGFNV
ncbi:MAG: metal-sulfur cluster assembly factor [Actinomyces graevenitzii]|nr:metal-sulfur cluster assembly factor [Actinomyces graevenitzii]MBF0972104.1 metal-sulfur cluster assembly factor [Actinomyces graevenitzii]MBS4942744.1 metal-sulfur cluster assembly factor [Actinomyces graevenitzii]MBS6934869.1 metal-sulfur cluster assembly factor [Actinomyces graevenitzii]PMC91016.1 metal-sulfur cluster assembly factor [Actinomyces graevenitzii]